MRRGLSLVSVLAATLSVCAGVEAAAAQPITPMGAIETGNADGSIPSYEGGLSTPPEGFEPRSGYPNPFQGDRPLLTLTASNHDQYQQSLTPGQIALFRTYPDSFQMPVYQTRRSASFPAWYVEASSAATPAATVTQSGALRIEGPGHVGVPFPTPTTGLEAITNHVTRYRGGSRSLDVLQAVPTESGSYNFVEFQDNYQDFHNGRPLGETESRYKYRSEIRRPARLAVTATLVHTSLDPVALPDQAWMYHVGIRRVRRAPNLFYDAPATAGDGLATYDMLDMFQGQTNRFEWELVGRREIYVPYNAYDLLAGGLSDTLRAGHLNPGLTRFERHRVWEVRATVKQGVRHQFASRTYYIDEDSWQILLAEHYDESGQIARVSMAHPISFYDVPVFMSAIEVHHDLRSRRYFVRGLLGLNEGESAVRFGSEGLDQDFTPGTLRRVGRR